MARPLAADAFEMHSWALGRILDAGEALTDEQLAYEAPGAFGSVMDTLRHVVEGDRFQLWAAGAGVPLMDASRMGFAELRAAGAANAEAWRRYLPEHPDGDERIVDVDEAGWQRTAAVGLRLAQALQHGIEHRTQVCAALTLLGAQAPDLSGWAFGAERGVVTEVYPQ